jgi:cob(I)alamin adenosyltransferase
MTIATQTGDNGTTALLFGKRVSKTHIRIMTNGHIDELSAVIGICRAHSKINTTQEAILKIQKELVHLMGELASENDHHERYLKKYADYAINQAMVDRLTDCIHSIEANRETPKGWSFPGENPAEAFFDQARTFCRRAERQVLMLRESGAIIRDVLIHYLNRLSDLLWLWGQKETD